MNLFKVINTVNACIAPMQTHTLFPLYAAATIGFNETDYSVMEGDLQVTFTVEVVGANLADNAMVEVRFFTTPGSALESQYAPYFVENNAVLMLMTQLFVQLPTLHLLLTES